MSNDSTPNNVDEETTEEESIKKIILDFIQHNPRHYIIFNLLGKEIRPCSRCFGLWMGLIIGFIFTSPFWLKFIHIDNFILVFTVAWLFAVPAIIDWITVILGLRSSNNRIRVVTGFSYGMGITIYFFVLPANILFKILTYALFEIIFHLIRWRFHIKHYNMKVKNKARI